LTERPKVRNCRLRHLQQALFLGAATTASKLNKEVKKDQDLDNISKDALKDTDTSTLKNLNVRFWYRDMIDRA
jgi:hypothetical protein